MTFRSTALPLQEGVAAGGANLRGRVQRAPLLRDDRRVEGPRRRRRGQHVLRLLLLLEDGAHGTQAERLLRLRIRGVGEDTTGECQFGGSLLRFALFLQALRVVTVQCTYLGGFIGYMCTEHILIGFHVFYVSYYTVYTYCPLFV